MVALPNRKQPPEWLPRAVVTILLVLAGASVVFWIVNQLRGLIYILFLSVFVAVAFEPAVQALVKRRWKRGLATLFVFVVGGLALFGFLAALIPVLVNQTSLLIDDLPQYLENVSGFLANLGLDIETPRVDDRFREPR